MSVFDRAFHSIDMFGVALRGLDAIRHIAGKAMDGNDSDKITALGSIMRIVGAVRDGFSSTAFDPKLVDKEISELREGARLEDAVIDGDIDAKFPRGNE